MAGSTLLPTEGGGLVSVRNLSLGDRVKGITAEREPAWCQVMAIGENGRGLVYGNYTERHFVLDDRTGTVVAHGPAGKAAADDLFDVLLDCPFGVDEAGTKYAAMANYNDVVGRQSLTFAEHLTLHKVLLHLVRKTGTFWMSSSSFGDYEAARRTQPLIIELMFECLADKAGSATCERFELAAANFVKHQYASRPSSSDGGSAGSPDAAERIHSAFPHLGDSGKEGSVSFEVRKVAATDNHLKLFLIIGGAAALVLGIAAVVVVRSRRTRQKSLEPQLLAHGAEMHPAPGALELN